MAEIGTKYVKKIHGFLVRDEEAQADIEALQKTTGTHTSEIANLKTTTAAHTSGISALEETSATHTSDIANLKTTTATHTSNIAALDAAVQNAGKINNVQINGNNLPISNKAVNIATDGDYNASTNKIATVSTVNNAVKKGLTELVEGTGKEGVVDTFMDMQEYIEAHGDEAADMAGNITKNANDIDNLEDRVDSLSIEEDYDEIDQNLTLFLGNGGSGNTGGGSSGGSSGGNCDCSSCCSSTVLTTEKIITEFCEVGYGIQEQINITGKLDQNGIYLFMLIKTRYDYLTTTNLDSPSAKKYTMYKGFYIHMGDTIPDSGIGRCEYVDMGLFDTRTGDHLYAHVTNEGGETKIRNFYLTSGLKNATISEEIDIDGDGKIEVDVDGDGVPDIDNDTDGVIDATDIPVIDILNQSYTPKPYLFTDGISDGTTGMAGRTGYTFSIHRVGSLGGDEDLNWTW